MSVLRNLKEKGNQTGRRTGGREEEMVEFSEPYVVYNGNIVPARA